MKTMKRTFLIAVVVAGMGAGEVPPLESEPRPESQTKFCKIIEDAAAAYAPHNKTWYDEANPIARERMTVELAAMRDARDKEVLAHLGVAKPAMDRWILKLAYIGTGPRKDEVRLDFTARCRVVVTISTAFIMTPAQAGLLAAAKRNGYFRVSGGFYGHDIDANPAHRALNWDGFEMSAMMTPSYKVTLNDIAGS